MIQWNCHCPWGSVFCGFLGDPLPMNWHPNKLAIKILIVLLLTSLLSLVTRDLFSSNSSLMSDKISCLSSLQQNNNHQQESKKCLSLYTTVFFSWSNKKPCKFPSVSNCHYIYCILYRFLSWRLTGLAEACGSWLCSLPVPPPGGASLGLRGAWQGLGFPVYYTVAGSGRNPSPGPALRTPAPNKINIRVMSSGLSQQHACRGQIRNNVIRG